MQFNSSQLQILSNIRNSNSPTRFIDGYTKVMEFISTPDGSAPLNSSDLASWVWIRGAMDVNQGNGAFSAFIRDYTSYQYNLRYGQTLNLQDLQNASNAIADGVLSLIINGSTDPIYPVTVGTLPSVGAIGKIDAQATTATIFNGDTAAWAGDVLFSYFGENYFLNKMLHPDSNSPPSSQSPQYNAIAAIDSILHATGESASLSAALTEIGNMITGYWPSGFGPSTSVYGAILYEFTTFLNVSYGVSSISTLFADTILGKMNIGNTPQNDTITSDINSSEIIHAGGGNDTINTTAISKITGDIIDGGTGYDVANFSAVATGMKLTADTNSYVNSRLKLSVDSFFAINYTALVNVEELRLGTGNDVVNMTVSAANPLEKMDTGAGNDDITINLLTGNVFSQLNTGNDDDTVSITGAAQALHPIIDLGSGNDILLNTTRGSIVYGGAGADSFELGYDYLIDDAAAEDKITYQGQQIHGGVTWKGQESEWAKGMYGIRYGYNSDNELVIKNLSGKDTYVAGFTDQLSGQTAGIRMGEMSLTSYRLFYTPHGAMIYESFEAVFGSYLKIMTGTSYFAGVDPLVLDLDGDGLELNARSSIAPYYDIDADGFGEQTGWVRGDDAFLVRDNNANGKIDNVSEMFGKQGTPGFTALAALDGNADGKISSLDSSYATLKIWRDLDGDAVTDTGELQTLSAAGIAYISLTNTATNQNIAGNIVTATGTFTRTNGTTGTIGDVTLRANQRDTVWLGDKTISAAAAALPEVKGYGTLCDLRIAMTDSALLKSAVQNALTQLGSLNLDSMRSVITPALNLWRLAVPVPAGNPGTVQRVDVPILTQVTLSGAVVNDFAYQVTDSQGTYWKLGSGAAVLNAQGVVIPRPTTAQVMAQTSTQGSWTTLSGQQIQFLERYLGTELPVGTTNNLSGASVVGAVNGLLNEMWRTLNDVAIKLAVQGPLASYFAGIVYNPITDKFEATTDHQIAPTIQAIFTAAPTNSSGAIAHLATWKPIIDVFLSSFDRGASGLEISYGFLMQNIIAAYENVTLATSLTQAADAFGIPADLIVTGAGTMNGTSDADIFYLGAGNQNAHGGVGPDSYIVGKNFGHDTIDGVSDVASGTPDTLRFAHLNSGQVTMVRDGSDLIITETGTSNDIRIIGQFAIQNYSLPLNGVAAYAIPTHGVEEIIFSNGEVWDRIDVAKAVSTHTNGDDIINGTSTIDFLDGGAGNDTLSGGIEGDIYAFGIGDASDKIYDNIENISIDTPDIVQFKGGLTLDMTTFTRQGASNDLVIKINGTDDQLTIQDQFAAFYTGPYGTQWFYRIEGFSFDDGTNISWDQVFDMVIHSAETSGNDNIYGFARTDIFDAGAGDDFLSGGEEGDLYIMGLGYGHDTIQDNRNNLLSGDNDTLQFLDGINPNEVTMFRPLSTDNLILTLIDGSSVTISNQFYLMDVFGGFDLDRIEYFTFADGTEWTNEYIQQHLLDITSTSGDDIIYGYLLRNDTINGGDGNDFIDGSTGDNIITGGKGNDTLTGSGNELYIYNQGDGNDAILEQGFSGNDTLELHGINLVSTNAIITRSANLYDATLSFGGLSDSIFLKDEFAPYGAGVEYISFSNSVTWNKNDIQLKYLSDVTTSGNDTIYGFGMNINDWVNDVISGGAGDDYMDGLFGDDTYIHNQGDGKDTVYDQLFSGFDTLKFYGANLTSANAIVTKSADLYSAIISFGGVNDSVILNHEFDQYGIENVIFSDGVIWDLEDLQNRYLSGAITSGNDTIYGFEYVNSAVNGGYGNDALNGLGGDDYLNGLSGDDTYTHNQGDGIDTIVEGYAAGNDTLVLIGNSLSSTNFYITPTGSNLYVATLSFGGVSDKISINEQLSWSTAYGIENIIFGDGLALSRSNLITGTTANDNNTNNYLSLNGNGNDNIMFGFAGDDIINGGDGNDLIVGGVGADQINGGNGIDTASYIDSANLVNVNLTRTGVQFGGSASNDILSNIENIIGSFSNDTLTGNASNNVITGGLGNDTINGGAGVDTVSYADSTAGVNINLALATAQSGGTAAGDILSNIESILGSAYNDIFAGNSVANNIDGGAGTDSVSYASSASGVTVNLALATAQSGGDAAGDVLANIENVTGSAYADTLTASATGSILTGAAGIDTLTGGTGNDTFVGGVGGDLINGGAGIDTGSYADSASLVNVNLTRTGVQFGGSATDDVLSNIENIIGSNFADILVGNTGANIISGGTAKDTMTGGTGADIFKYSAITDSGAASGVRDIIADFSQAQADKIDLGDFAGTFVFKGTGAFTGTAHEVNYAQLSGNTIIGVDADGNGVLDFQIEMTGLHNLAVGDFLL